MFINQDPISKIEIPHRKTLKVHLSGFTNGSGRLNPKFKFEKETMSPIVSFRRIEKVWRSPTENDPRTFKEVGVKSSVGY